MQVDYKVDKRSMKAPIRTKHASLTHSLIDDRYTLLHYMIAVGLIDDEI